MPHNGCPHQCSFCNQRGITGQNVQPTPNDVAAAIETAIKSGVDTQNTEIAFFGGSFTAIDRDYMVSLLDAAKPYIKEFYGIRCSTRPDAINREILDLLKSYGVTSIELGAQSMCDDVLLKNERGHSSTDVVKSSNLIKDYGISLGLQMMTGLYGSDIEKDYYTAEKIAELCPDTVRIYPTITMKNTRLEDLYKSGKYVPYNEEETISVCAHILNLFYSKDINVIRVGLHYSKDLTDNKIAGYYHPAFREICESRIFYNKLLESLSNSCNKGDYTVYVGQKFLSKAVGQKKSNIIRLREKGYNIKFVPDDNIKDFDFLIDKLLI